MSVFFFFNLEHVAARIHVRFFFRADLINALLSEVRTFKIGFSEFTAVTKAATDLNMQGRASKRGTGATN